MARRLDPTLDARVVGGAGTIGSTFDVLLSAARANAPWAFERIYKELAPAVHGYLRLQGSTEPDDLTSEVFLGTFKGLSGFNGDESAFRSWVFTIAHRRLVDERRRYVRRPSPVANHARAPETTGGDVEDDALGLLAEQRVRRLCESLSPDHRDVLLLRLVAGFTIEQIAETLGRTPASVKAIQRRGLASIRRQLELERESATF